MIARDSRRRYWLLAVVVMLITAAWRLVGLGDASLTVDESTIVMFAQGVLQHGYPVIHVGNLEVQLATYELIPYFIAPFMALFGSTDFVLRLHSALFAVGTSYLVFSAGRKWFDLRTGFIAGLLYANMPWAIFWGQNAFHPQAQQFFATLALIYAVQILRANPVPTRAYYLAAVFFSCAFLSWEGLGFMLPVLFVAGVIGNWGRWGWLRNVHLWIACAIVFAVVVIQGARRILLLDNYLMVGSGRSQITGPELAFLEPYYHPYFYFDQIFFRYPQLAVSIVFCLGLIFARRNWHLRFLSTFVLTAVILVANLLSFYTMHYIYFVLPAFVIAVAACTVMFSDWLRQHRAREWQGSCGASAVLLVLVALELLTSGAYGLKTYSITEEARSPKPTNFGTRLGMELIDHRGILSGLQTRARPGDPVLTIHPMTLNRYLAERGDLSMQSMTYQKVVFDPRGDRARYIDIYGGNPVLRTQREVDDALARHERIWFVEPTDIFAITTNKVMQQNFQRRTTLEAESYLSKLHLWVQ